MPELLAVLLYRYRLWPAAGPARGLLAHGPLISPIDDTMGRFVMRRCRCSWQEMARQRAPWPSALQLGNHGGLLRRCLVLLVIIKYSRHEPWNDTDGTIRVGCGSDGGAAWRGGEVEEARAGPSRIIRRLDALNHVTRDGGAAHGHDGGGLLPVAAARARERRLAVVA